MASNQGASTDEGGDVILDLTATYAQTVINQLLHGGGGEQTSESSDLTQISSGQGNPDAPILEVMTPIKNLVNNASRHAMHAAG